MTNQLLLALALALVTGCGGKTQTTTTSNTTNTTTTPAVAANGGTGTLKELQNGDRACYVVLVNEKGEEQSIEGDFELCAGGEHDATPLIGKKITYTTESANVQAESCQGNPDCTATDVVQAVNTITVAE
jgi:hypothetical protein